MAYTETENAIIDAIEGLTPYSKPAITFKRIRGARSWPADPVANSGKLRAFEFIPLTTVRGTAANGTGAKQLIASCQLLVYYPMGELADEHRQRLQEDKNSLMELLESIDWYDFNNTGLQNIQWITDTTQSKDGNMVLVVTLQVTYFSRGT